MILSGFNCFFLLLFFHSKSVAANKANHISTDLASSIN